MIDRVKNDLILVGAAAYALFYVAVWAMTSNKKNISK